MRSLTLYELADEYQALLNGFYDYDAGVVDETALDKIDSLKDSIQNKCINVVKVFRSMELTKESIKAEKERLYKKEKAFNQQVEWLKDYLLINMQKSEIKKIECPEFSISLQQNPPSVDIIDENEVPIEYDKPHKRVLDIDRMRRDMKNGTPIKGAQLIKKNSVRIR